MVLSHARTRTSSSSSPLSFARSACLPACLPLFLSLSRFLFLPLYRFLFRIGLLLDLDTPAALGLGCCWTWAHRRLFGHGGTIAEWLVGPLLPCISPLHNDKASKIRAGLPPQHTKVLSALFFLSFLNQIKHITQATSMRRFRLCVAAAVVACALPTDASWASAGKCLAWL